MPSIPGDRETLLSLLDRCQQEIDRLTGELCNDHCCSVLPIPPWCVFVYTCHVFAMCS